jgi:hypothetical protein
LSYCCYGESSTAVPFPPASRSSPTQSAHVAAILDFGLQFGRTWQFVFHNCELSIGRGRARQSQESSGKCMTHVAAPLRLASRHCVPRHHQLTS